MSNKRRFVEQLPHSVRTPDLQKFFGATVDHVFQPGAAEPLSGYIGQYPTYFDPKKDFYLSETTRERTLRQLDPAMVTVANGKINSVLFYADLVNDLASQGAITSDEQRLFEADYYSWCPPIDVAKLLSYQNYFWFSRIEDLPALTLHAPVITHTGNGIRTAFLMPSRIAAIAQEDETPAVWINGIPVPVVSHDGERVTVILAPAVGDKIEVYRYSDLSKLMVGKTSFNPSSFAKRIIEVRANGSNRTFEVPPVFTDMPSGIFDIEVRVAGRLLLKSEWTTADGSIILDAIPAAGQVVQLARYHDVPANSVTALLNNMRVVLNDATRRAIGYDVAPYEMSDWDDLPPRSYLVEGIPTSLMLVDHQQEASQLPEYRTVDRRSRDRNPWSRTNRWVHRSAFAWAGVTFPNRGARRPVVEFIPNIELAEFGRRPIGSVNAILSGLPVLDGTPLTSAAQINGSDPLTVMVDDGHLLDIGDRLLIRTAVSGRVDLSYSVVNIVEALNAAGKRVLACSPEIDTLVGDYVELNDEFYHRTDDGWERSQARVAGTPPRFATYNANGKRRAQDSLIFSYATGTGSLDSVLGIKLRHDALGQIVFENNINTDAGSDMALYRLLGSTAATDEVSSVWQPVATPTSFSDAESPPNLQANPNNEDVSFISKNELLDHFKAIIENNILEGEDAFGQNSWNNSGRDLRAALPSPLKILQHRSSLLKTMLLSSQDRIDLPAAIRFVEHEYTRFRARFVHAATVAYQDGRIRDTDTGATMARLILQTMKANKTVEFAFALNRLADTADRETFFVPPTPAALGISPAVEPVIATDTSLGIEINQLVGHDGSRLPLFGDTHEFIADEEQTQFVLESDPLGTIAVSVDGVVVPSRIAGRVVTVSPVALGTQVSITITDVRDRALLAFEQSIYATIPAAFRAENDNVAAFRGFELRSWIEGAWRKTGDNGYTREEFNRILSPMFLSWVQKGNFDYRDNSAFEQHDPFTWNYSTAVDLFGNSLAGNWRGIYLDFYDTYRPNSAPWEMLGFAQKPIWWEDEYGPAPYTSNNAELWRDLEEGRIARGVRAGINPLYQRAGLSNLLPVDDLGDLLDPIAIGIVPQAPTFYQASRQWVAGDLSPVEELWRSSPSYHFAIAMASYLMKPARFVEQCWDTITNVVIGEQLIDTQTGKRPQTSEQVVHGERNTAGVRQPRVGLQQWIGEHMISLGQEPSLLGNLVRQVDVRLGHRMAGFTDPANLRVVADNFGLVPQEDVSVVLYRSAPNRHEFYSGVIVEWSGTGWRVFGYNSLDPVFYIEPGDDAGRSLLVSAATVPEVVIVDWKPNVHYRVNMLVEYQNSIYQCSEPHTSSSSFEQEFWLARPGILRPSAARVAQYLDPTGERETVPYGTEFSTPQEVADFLFAYGRALENAGWKFPNEDEAGPVDWTRAVQDYLEWAVMEWEEGNFIALSPGAGGVQFETNHGTIYSLNHPFGIIDRGGLPISSNDSQVSRVEGEVTIRAFKSDLFGARVNVGEIEHAVLFSNQTIFSDLIYKPLYDLRQPRLRLSGQRAVDWNGRFDAPGYIITDDGIVSNFDRAAEDIRYAFDIEGVASKNLQDHARHMVGYESRDYMRNLLLSETQQFEFYQGMIQQKGSPGVFNKVLRSQFIEQDRNLKFLEEWAFKTAQYGALDQTVRFAFELRQSDMQRNPQLLRFHPTEVAETKDGVLHVPISRFLSGTEHVPAAFKQRSSYATRKGDLPSAGYARLDEVDYTTVSVDTLASLYALAASANGKAFAQGERIWVYDGSDHRFDVLRATDLGPADNRITHVETSVNGAYSGARLYLEHNHGLTADDAGMLLVIDGETRTAADLSGVQRVFDAGDNWIELELSIDVGYVWISDGSATELEIANDPENSPVVRALRSVRFATIDHLSAAFWFTPQLGEIAYIDHDPAQSSEDPRWVVRQFGRDWNHVYRVQPRKVDSAALVASLVYDATSKITQSRLISEPLVIDRFTVVDPLAGILPGEAVRELSYQIEYDPARYNRGEQAGVATWGGENVGELWWDLSTVRFLTAETDEPAGPRRVDAEQLYRADNWGKIAPGTRADVYEWVRSLVPPAQYSGEGTVYRSSAPNWVEAVEFDPALNRDVNVYFFWVRDLTSVSRSSTGRRLDASTVSRIISDPTGLDRPWIAPTFVDGMMIGGVSQFLTPTTVMQIDVERQPGDGVVHTEWELLRAGDARSQPSTALWNKLIDSLAGADRFKRQVPDPRLNRQAAQGIGLRPRQSLFGGSTDDRATMRLARESLIGILNRIFSREDIVRQRVAAVNTLLASRDVLDRRGNNVMSWSAQDSSSVVLPAKSEYEVEVFSIPDRDALLLTPDFARARRFGEKRRVLVNALEAQVPFWSMWVYDGATDQQDENARMENPNDFFKLANYYDVKVASRAERDALTPVRGQIIYVEADEDASAFWTLWRYDPSDYRAVNGFVLLRAQDYQVGDFIQLADWYADGYSAENAPVVSFRSKTERDAGVDASSSTFVRLDDEGDEAGWVWTVLEDGEWKTVARQNRTLRILPSLFENLLLGADETQFGTSLDTVTTLEWETFNWDDAEFDGEPYARHVLANVSRRDGALDLRAMMDVLINQVLTEEESNELFFSMIHFAHSTFDQINWAFKTSFLYIGGYNESLIQAPIQTSDTTENLLSYIDEVKPYRVKTRDFARGLAPAIENLPVRATDFDKPAYYDAALGRNRRLNTDAADAATLALPQWKDWNDNYKKSGTNLADYTASSWNPVRRIKTKLIFDRYDGWDDPTGNVPFYTGGAADRIRDHYKPKFPGQLENDIPTLLKLGFRGVALDGQDYGSDLLDYDAVIEGNGREKAEYLVRGTSLASTALTGDKPEELLRVVGRDHTRMFVRSLGKPGAPQQTTKYFDLTGEHGSSTVLSFSELPQSSAGLAVFIDGIRVGEDRYKLDHFRREIVIDLDHAGSRVADASVHIFGTAGKSKLIEQRFFTFSVGDANAFPITQKGSIEVFLNGVAAQYNYRESSADVEVLAPLLLGDDVLINVRQSNDALLVQVEDLPYRANGTWQLKDWNTLRPDAHAMAIVELDGRRLLPPETKYLRVSSGYRWVPVDNAAISYSEFDSDGFDDNEYDVSFVQAANWTIYVGSNVYRGLLDDVSNVFENLREVAQSGVQAAQFVYWRGYVVCVDPDIFTDDVVITIETAHDYTISPTGELQLIQPPAKSAKSRVRVTTFSDPAAVGVETWTYKGRESGVYPIYRPQGGHYVWLTVNGLKRIFDVDYTIEQGITEGNWDIDGWDAATYDPAIDSVGFVSTDGNWDVDAWDVADEFDAETAPQPVVTFPRGHDAEDEIIISVFHKSPQRQPSGYLAATVASGNAIAADLSTGWEYTDVNEGQTGKLEKAITPTSSAIAILYPRYSHEALAGSWFTHPTQDAPGVVWIGGERVEYSQFEESNDRVVLRGLSRSSRGTQIGEHPAGTPVIALLSQKSMNLITL